MVQINSEKDFLEYANTLTFRYAKTYTNFAPHEYAMGKDGSQELEVIRALNKYIQEHAEIEFFAGKEYQVIFVGNKKYWSIDVWNETRFLNRNWDFKNEDGTINKSITESYKGT